MNPSVLTPNTTQAARNVTEKADRILAIAEKMDKFVADAAKKAN
ncbi:hypothetical protein LEM8419_03509 [Neolewinella maritima]|uniref:Uncharacterized protein n=1 Tax=Neolewinella maritima TaxID=1383882 RepID=A0ABN8F6Q0_9BACT|nr:hypothetical protein [Neolewinella maritima]CAH1002637.1 hypothetical protein LEM8419_03509 [Neolewinella maritima]